MDAEVEGEDAKIAFNSRYLQDVLQVLGGGRLGARIDRPIESLACCARRGRPAMCT